MVGYKVLAKTEQRVRGVLKEIVTPLLPIIWLAVTAVVSLAGPFGMFNTVPLWFRIAYWAPMIAVTIVVAIALRIFCRTVVGTTDDWKEDALVVAPLSIVIGQMVVLVNGYFWPGEFLVSALFVSTLSVLIGGCVCLMRRFFQHQKMVSDSPTQRDRLLDRMTVNDAVRLVRISSDNHHIRILTTDGKEHRLLMRLRDAVGEVDVEPGMLVHRSHWVATSAISRVVETGGREAVELSSGETVPIGPKNRSNLVEAGIISA